MSLNPEVIAPLYTMLTTPRRVIKAHEISGQECTILSFSCFILRMVSSSLFLAVPGLAMLDSSTASLISLSGTVSDGVWELDNSRLKRNSFLSVPLKLEIYQKWLVILILSLPPPNFFYLQL